MPDAPADTRGPPIRVAFVTVFGRRGGGSDEFLWTFLRHVDRSRVEPLVVFLEDGPFVAEVAALGIGTAVVPSGRLREPHRAASCVLRLARLLRRLSPDLVLAWLSTAQLYTAPAAVIAGLAGRCAWWQHDLPARRTLSREGAIDRLATMLPAIAVGAYPGDAAEAQAKLWPRRRVLAVAPGIDAPARPSQELLDALSGELGLPAGRAVVGIVGRLLEWKGHDRVLAALALLRTRGFDVHGLVVGGPGHGGDVAYARRLQALAEKPELDGAVTFTGEVPSSMPHMALMDVLVNASDREPFGIVLLEAMALGTPVVAVDSAGPSGIVEPGRSGMLAPTRTPEDLAGAIGALLEDSALRERVAAAGRERFAARFTSARMARDLENRLVELAPGVESRRGVP